MVTQATEVRQSAGSFLNFFLDESNSEDATGTTTVITARRQYILETFYVIIDSLLVALQKRKDAYMMLGSCFGVLTQFNRMTDAEIRDGLKH